MRGLLIIILLLGSSPFAWVLAECAPASDNASSAEVLPAEDLAGLMRELEALAAQGDIDAQYEIGWLYFEGRHLARDYATAHQWFLLAAEQGDVFAQELLGDMYRDGLGVDRSVERAREWYRRAADQWLATAQYKLGMIYSLGDGVERDYGEAFRYLKFAAAQGYDDAQVRLGDMYAQGIGVEVDDALAYMWFYIPALSGCEEAIEKRDRIRPRLNLLQAWAMRYTASDCIENQFRGC